MLVAIEEGVFAVDSDELQMYQNGINSGLTSTATSQNLESAQNQPSCLSFHLSGLSTSPTPQCVNKRTQLDTRLKNHRDATKRQ